LTDQHRGIPGINPSVPHPARIYDYLLGGRDNFPVDREAGEQVIAAIPNVREMARENRWFLQRVVRYLAAEAGIRQFIDIGTGIPTQGNVHEVVQAVAPDARVVYVDNDPIVHVHSDALLAGNSTTIVLGDLREPDAILDDPKLLKVIDFDEPVAILLVAILHFITHEDDAAGIVARLRDAMAPGSYLVVTHFTQDFDPAAARKVMKAYERAAAPSVPRSHAEVERLFDGFELLEPELVQISRGRPDEGHEPIDVWGWAGVGRKL
jgi:hypothetical protein